MYLITFLIVFSLLAGLGIAIARDVEKRAGLVRISAAIIAVASVVLALVQLQSGAQFFGMNASVQHALDSAFMVGSVLLSLFLLYLCRRIKVREWWVPALIVVQTGLLLYAETSSNVPAVVHPLYTDSFSVLMALIIGIVGGLICIHAIRYMHDYQEHKPDVSDRRPAFYFMLFLFLAAMFGIVFSNDLRWLFFFWEVTTFCSFWMISYAGNEESIRNGYRALGFNLIGGVGFAAAIAWLVDGSGGLHTLELDKVIAGGSALALIPVALISVAGLTKSAQLPFSSWLLGAMVAPTPVSALLHSSTMVKAGVFILVKFAPVYHDTVVGLLLSLVGGVTFLATSLVAVNQRNAKLVLAYSTIANLGLIVMCAGLGTPATLWAAILLILFHGVAKALLFLGVGTTEHLIGSRDIEDMEGLVYRRPAMAGMLMVGILGMFLAPFGMLISKYTCLKAFLTVDVMPGDGLLLVTILAFGSAPTLFFWSKWMGKLVALPRRSHAVESWLPKDEAIALYTLTVLTCIACVLFPAVDWAFIQPYTEFLVNGGLMAAPTDIIPTDTIVMMSAMLLGLFLLPLAFWVRPPQHAEVTGYLAGANVDGSASYRGAGGAEREVESRGYYLTSFVKEGTVIRLSVVASALLILFMVFGAAV